MFVGAIVLAAICRLDTHPASESRIDRGLILNPGWTLKAGSRAGDLPGSAGAEAIRQGRAESKRTGKCTVELISEGLWDRLRRPLCPGLLD
jgi:hypothetical protein